MDVTTLQGEDLGRVNMNKLKSYQESETTQAYALQILACHIGSRNQGKEIPNLNQECHSTSFIKPLQPGNDITY